MPEAGFKRGRGLCSLGLKVDAGGVVNLSGAIGPRPAAKAGEVARQVEGVKAVANYIVFR
jgi:osmotically-inducible protein OsmY